MKTVNKLFKNVDTIDLYVHDATKGRLHSGKACSHFLYRNLNVEINENTIVSQRYKTDGTT
jgi:hypothetical protein